MLYENKKLLNGSDYVPRDQSPQKIIDPSGAESIVFDENDLDKYQKDNGVCFSMERQNNKFSMEGERAFIKEAAVADGTYMQAPNGKPTKLTERQWLTVRTKAFKAWFGDWEKAPDNASKVPDENGEPRVVYHGTATDGLTIFDHKKAQEKIGRKYAMG